MRAHAHMCTCAPLCRVQKLTMPGVSQLLLTLSFLGKASHWNWSLPVWLGGPTAGSRDRSSCLSLLSAEITSMLLHLAFTGGQGDQTPVMTLVSRKL